MAQAYCPECDEIIKLSTPKIGQKVTCRHCEAELEVVELDPLELDWAYDDFDDDEDDFDDDDDDFNDDEDDFDDEDDD